MKIVASFLILVISVTFLSCSPSRQKMAGKISSLEAKMKTSTSIDTNAVNELISGYQKFVTRFPDDSLSPDYLYRAASIAAGYQKGNQAIELFQKIITSYPNYKKTPECYFMLAFTYENVLGNLGKANEMYNTFIAKYPDHQLVQDAKTAIKYLGKSPDAMIRDFERQNAVADSLKTAGK